jgi:quercetin dioxygenase-like cupin family protein
MKRAERQPVTISVTIYGGIYYKVWTVPDAGTLIPQHAHAYDHLTALLQGAVRVLHEDGELSGEYHAPDTIHIAARQKHSFLTLTGDTVLACIHNADHADPDGEPIVTEEHQIVGD